MAKYCKKIVTQICKLIESDSYTAKEVCEHVNISQETFITWKREKPEFSESIKRAEQVFLKTIASEAKKSLMKKIQGYTVQEKRTVYNGEAVEGKSKPKIKEQTVTDKYFQPDTATIIFALCNQDSDNFKNKQSTEVTGAGGKDLIRPRTLTKEEAKELWNDFENGKFPEIQR